ncbi:hypothetical protein DPMN_120436 [Dreissena polymorpha]|uniref:Uncharacterized protein n=1 Tax=Dreissena polymorpha TaxID=45954 RepID=A0A9D4GNA5_DREPO|nr:hypothetical protein DPMN_120436 [Dreissena polymorpha]
MQRMLLNEYLQYRREGGDEINSMRFANDGLGTQTSRIDTRTVDGYIPTNLLRPMQSAMQSVPGIPQQRPTEYSPVPQQQQQQQQPLGQNAIGRGIITSEILESNLSTHDVEIDNPTSSHSQGHRGKYDQGRADNGNYCILQNTLL